MAVTVYSFNKDKAVNALLYIAHKISNKGIADKYATLKILYFAEKKHLAEYGRLITDDRFAALKYGPVPSNSCDLLDPNFHDPNFNILDNKSIVPISNPNLDTLSESDVECLDASIEENKSLTFSRLKNKSHDSAYNKAFNHDIHFMDIEEIAKDAGADNSIINYINEYYSSLAISSNRCAIPA